MLTGSLQKELNQKSSVLYSNALKIAEKLHENRINGARLLETAVCETLGFLDMEKVVFKIIVNINREENSTKLDRDGIDTVEFLISTNKGLDAKPLSKIASGGELARIMLALRSAIVDKDSVGTVIFDEIDAGVSGKTARKIGIKMQSFSANTQLLCVTHSAQIASLADDHYLISKSDTSGMTETSVRLLDTEGRINELSRILGGINVTQSQRDAALDMLRERESYKASLS